VDDEALAREPVRRLLVAYGYIVLTAASADQAIGLAEDHPGSIDLLLTDVAMPGRTGPQLSREVARRRPGVKVLFTSGYDHESLVEHGVLVAGDHLLPKPCPTSELLRKVRAALDAPPTG
jgi:hypothetical protein